MGAMARAMAGALFCDPTADESGGPFCGCRSMPLPLGVVHAWFRLGRSGTFSSANGTTAGDSTAGAKLDEDSGTTAGPAVVSFSCSSSE